MAPKKLIIDTDPGVDDAMAIAAAFNSPEVEITGFTTIFGNVHTPMATQNAFILTHLAGREGIPVAEGSHAPLSGIMKEVASFVHGDDGFGNTNQAIVQGRKIDKTAAHFIADTVNADPGNVSILALGPLTNIAMAFQASPEVAKNLAELVILGGAFDVEGNVNPAAEANIWGDAEAADFVMTQSDKIRVVGLDVTYRCLIQATALISLKGQGRFGSFLYDVTQFYLKFHRNAYGMEAIHVHDPTAFLAVIQPELFTWRSGPVRVITQGIAMGKTIQNHAREKWNAPNGWTGQPRIQVAVDVNIEAAVESMLQRMRG